MQTVAALLLIATGLACASLGVLAIVIVRPFRRPKVMLQTWREMTRPGTTIFDTPVAREVMDDLRRHPDIGAEAAGQVRRFIDTQAAGDTTSFKGVRRFVNVVMFAGALGPGLVALGLLAVVGGVFWLR